MVAPGVGSFVSYDFQYGDLHTYQVLRAPDIGFASEEPGLYAWYLRVLPNTGSTDALASYTGVLAGKRLQVCARAHLGEEYRGDLDRTRPDRDSLPGLTGAIAAASAVFSPPIYIGISKGMRSRLQQHVRALEDTLARTNGGTGASQPPELAIDTTEESSVFGERIGDLLRTHGQTILPLFVKIIYQPSIERAELRAAERFANRAFLPLFGRR